MSGSAKAPHPRERVISCKPGQVIAFHHNTLHSGMYNNSQTERRYYVSLFYTRLGLRSRNIPSLVDEMLPSHPLHAVLDKAVAERDEQVLSLFGKQHGRSLSSALRSFRTAEGPSCDRGAGQTSTVRAGGGGQPLRLPGVARHG